MKTFNYSSKASIKDNLTEILIGAALIRPYRISFRDKNRSYPYSRAIAHCYYPCDCRSIHAIQSMAKNTAGPYIGS